MTRARRAALATALLALSAVWASASAQAPAGADAVDPVTAAQARAKAQHQPLFVEFHAPWCYSCYFMAQHVQAGPDWEALQKQVVRVELDADSPEGQRWMAAWHVQAMPTYLLFDAEGGELGRILAEQTRTDFYRWARETLARGHSLDTLKAAVTDGGEPSLAAAREVLRAYHERYDPAGGLSWFVSLPPPARRALARDAASSGWIARLELQRAAAEGNAASCAAAADMVLGANLGCERPYELSKVMACTQKLGEPARTNLLRPQLAAMQVLADKRVFSDFRCADERSVITGTADLYAALGDPAGEKAVLDKAIEDLKKRIGGDPKKDRNLSDNLRVYLDRAGRAAELEAWLDTLIAAYPGDYVYAFRKGKVLAARGEHAAALALFEQAATKAYGINQLDNAGYRARSLQALGRSQEARSVLAEVLKTTGPFFPEEARQLEADLQALDAPPAKAP